MNSALLDLVQQAQMQLNRKFLDDLMRDTGGPEGPTRYIETALIPLIESAYRNLGPKLFPETSAILREELLRVFDAVVEAAKK